MTHTHELEVRRNCAFALSQMAQAQIYESPERSLQMLPPSVAGAWGKFCTALISSKVQEKVQEKVQDKVQEKVQDKVQEKVQGKVQEKVQQIACFEMACNRHDDARDNSTTKETAMALERESE